MDDFKVAVMKIATFCGPPTAARKILIENRFRDFSTNLHTPDHPTYAAMIHKAIAELNEEDGSSERSISEFIRKEYDDLPWAHSTFLKYHLEKLCGCGEIVVTHNWGYLLASNVTDPKSIPCPSGSSSEEKQMKKKGKSVEGQACAQLREMNELYMEGKSVEGNKQKEQMEANGVKKESTRKQVEVIEGEYQVQEERNHEKERHSEMIESELKELENGMIENSLQLERENGVSEVQNQTKEPQNDATDNQKVNEEKESIEKQVEVFEGQYQVQEEHMNAIGGKNQAEERQNEMIESELKELHNGMVASSQQPEQENGVSEVQNRPKELQIDATDEQNQHSSQEEDEKPKPEEQGRLPRPKMDIDRDHNREFRTYYRHRRKKTRPGN